MGKLKSTEQQNPVRPKGRERRRQERFDCSGFAEVVVDDAAFLFRGNIQNLSLGGCYIQSRAGIRLERGTEADLHFTLGGDFFHARARIMIVRSGAGVGFEFLFDDPELQKRIAKIIQNISSAALPDLATPAGRGGEGIPRGRSRGLWERAQ